MKLHPYGLRPTKVDKRDFSRHRVFGTPPLLDLPPEYSNESGDPYLDQGSTDFCSGYSVIESERDTAGMDFSPDYQYAKTKQIEGTPHTFGADLRDAMKAPVIYGLLPIQNAPFSWKEKGRDFVADWKNWPEELDSIASQHKEGSFFSADGPYDPFDNIRSSIWQHRDKKRDVILGTRWLWGYQYLGADGIAHQVPEDKLPQQIGWHAYEVKGWKLIGGVPHLIARVHYLSIGDHGYVYIPRESINQEMRVSGAAAFMFHEVDKDVFKNTSLTNQEARDLIAELFRRIGVLLAKFIPLIK